MRKIGKYQVLGLLGRGGMGAVYKVRMPVTGKIMALKLLSPRPFLAGLIGRAAIDRQFRAEATTLGGLHHPHIAEVWDFGQTGRRLYFLMEYFCRDLGQVIGESAQVEAPTRRLPLPRAVSYTLQTLSGLARLHHAGIVHRDIKPYNLLITGEDQIKITDFGLSRLRGQSLARSPGLKVGSPYYAAPEQEEDPQRAGLRADLYSAGVTLYRMLTGQLPVWPLEGKALPSGFSSDLDQRWDDYFKRVLHPKPGRRPESAKAMAGELEELLEMWRIRLEKACRLREPDTPPPCPVNNQPFQSGQDHTESSSKRDQSGPSAHWGHGVPIRSQPLKARGAQAQAAFGLDALWRPLCYAQPILWAQGEIVQDTAAHRIWQRSGSEYALDWAEAHEYVEALNAKNFWGATGWRLPTVDELVSVLSPPAEFTGHCLDPVFDQEKRLLWSADRRTFTQAWFVDAELGAVAGADMTCRRYVRAVRQV